MFLLKLDLCYVLVKLAFMFMLESVVLFFKLDIRYFMFKLGLYDLFAQARVVWWPDFCDIFNSMMFLFKLDLCNVLDNVRLVPRSGLTRLVWCSCPRQTGARSVHAKLCNVIFHHKRTWIMNFKLFIHMYIYISNCFFKCMFATFIDPVQNKCYFTLMLTDTINLQNVIWRNFENSWKLIWTYLSVFWVVVIFQRFHRILKTDTVAFNVLVWCLCSSWTDVTRLFKLNLCDVLVQARLLRRL